MGEGQTSGGGRARIYSCKRHMFVHKIVTYVTVSVYIKKIGEFEIFWKYLPQKFNFKKILPFLCAKGNPDKPALKAYK